MWLPLVHDLLALLGDVPVDSEALGLAEFRSHLEAYYHRLENAASPEVEETIARECVSFCQEFQRKLQSHLAERESEVTDLVRVVEQLVATMSGQTTSIGQLAGSSDRLTRIVEIDDIRILKRRLSLELVTLRRVIDEQRQKHEEHQKKLSGEMALLQKRLERVQEEASLDGLTRIPNRARFDRTLRRWVSMHKHSGQRFVLAILDVDDFKNVNDRCGHPEGDRVLCEIATALRTHVRSTDLVARYGGDEFVVLLAGADLTHAEQRVRTALARIRDVKVDATLDDGSPSDRERQRRTHRVDDARFGKSTSSPAPIARCTKERRKGRGPEVARPPFQEPTVREWPSSDGRRQRRHTAKPVSASSAPDSACIRCRTSPNALSSSP